jgi:hypothetical protein
MQGTGHGTNNNFSGLPSSLNTTMHLSTTMPHGSTQPYEGVMLNANSFNLSNMTTQRNGGDPYGGYRRADPSVIVSGETLLSSPEFDKENHTLHNMATSASLGTSNLQKNYAHFA